MPRLTPDRDLTGIRFWTGRLAGAAHTPPGAYDVTWSTGDNQYAPTGEMLAGIKQAEAAGPVAHEAAWGQYRYEYLALLRQRYRDTGGRLFDDLLMTPDSVLCCYCANPGRCHRTLLAWALCHLGAHYAGEWRPRGRALGITGSRAHPYPDRAIAEAMDQLPGPGLGIGPWAYVVHGGADGIDAAAERYCYARGIPCITLAAGRQSWRRWGKGAGFVRNGWIVRSVDQILAVPWGEARGTYNCIDQARRAGLPVYMAEVLPSGPH